MAEGGWVLWGTSALLLSAAGGQDGECSGDNQRCSKGHREYPGSLVPAAKLETLVWEALG